MTPELTGTRTALRGLDQALDAPRQHGAQTTWRRSVRKRMASLHDSLGRETPPASESWLAPRCGAMARERDTLLGRIATLRMQVQQPGEVDTVRTELKRLLADVNHHLQRLHDLAYDDVELELGGSE